MEKQRHMITARTACLIWHKGKLLLIEYSAKKGEREGWYNRLGGHMEQGEGILESAKREIVEETGLHLDAKLKGIIHFSNFFGKDGIMYVTSSESDTDIVQNNDEGTLHRVDPKELGNYKIFKDMKIVVDKIYQMKEGVVFTAKEKFDGAGEVISFEIE